MSQDGLAGMIGRVLGGRYRLATHIGAGRFTNVFLAYDLSQSRRVAVKLLAEEVMPGGWVRDEVFIGQFLGAAEEAVTISHPHLVAVRGWGDSDFGPYVVTEFMEGGSLQRMLATGFCLSPSQALMVGLEVTRGLEIIHANGFIHRDIRPSNILFDRRGRARLADLGTSWVLTSSEASGALVARSVFTSREAVRYASPEQAQGLEPDHKSDVYSLVLVLTEALSGRVPFESDSAEYTQMAKMSRQLDLAGQFDRLGRVLETAGRPDRGERPSAHDLGRGLLAAAQTLPRPDPLPLPKSGTEVPTSAEAWEEDRPAERGKVVDAPASNRLARRRLVLTMLTVLVMGILGFGGYALWQSLFGAETQPVPDLSEAVNAELLGLETEFGWVLDRREQRQDGTSLGQVLRQSPEPGIGLEKGETVTVWVSLGPELAVLPPGLTGLGLEDAEMVLKGAGLAMGQVSERYHETAIVGTVVQVNELFTELEPGSSVDVVVSLGPAPRTVPDIAAGTSLAVAQEVLEEARLDILEWRESSVEVEVDHVIRVNPPPGTEVPADSIVTVVISDGPEIVRVPPLATLGVEEARLLLAEYGLCLGQVDGPGDTEVLASNPPGGTSIESGMCVNLITRSEETPEEE